MAGPDVPTTAPALALVPKPAVVPPQHRPIVHRLPAAARIGGAAMLARLMSLVMPALLDLKAKKEVALAEARTPTLAAALATQAPAATTAATGAAAAAPGAQRRRGAGRGAAHLAGAAVFQAAVQQLGRAAERPAAPACADGVRTAGAAGQGATAGEVMP